MYGKVGGRVINCWPKFYNNSIGNNNHIQYLINYPQRTFEGKK